MEHNIILKVPNEQLLEKMIEEEEQIRTSKYYQDKCTEVKNIPNGWLTVTEDIQKNIVKKYGFTDQMSCDVACNMARRAHILFPNNKKFRDRVQTRNNKAIQGCLEVGNIVPNVSLYDLNNDSTSLHEITGNTTTIIFAGSQT